MPGTVLGSESITRSAWSRLQSPACSCPLELCWESSPLLFWFDRRLGRFSTPVCRLLSKMKRAVRMLIRIIAVALVLFGALEIGVELVHHQVQVHNHVDPIKTNIWHYIIGTILIVVGIILFAGSESLAEQLTDDIEE